MLAESVKREKPGNICCRFGCSAFKAKCFTLGILFSPDRPMSTGARFYSRRKGNKFNSWVLLKTEILLSRCGVWLFSFSDCLFFLFNSSVIVCWPWRYWQDSQSHLARLDLNFLRSSGFRTFHFLTARIRLIKSALEILLIICACACSERPARLGTRWRRGIARGMKLTWPLSY